MATAIQHQVLWSRTAHRPEVGKVRKAKENAQNAGKGERRRQAATNRRAGAADTRKQHTTSARIIATAANGCCRGTGATRRLLARHKQDQASKLARGACRMDLHEGVASGCRQRRLGCESGASPTLGLARSVKRDEVLQARPKVRYRDTRSTMGGRGGHGGSSRPCLPLRGGCRCSGNAGWRIDAPSLEQGELDAGRRPSCRRGRCAWLPRSGQVQCPQHAPPILHG